MWILKLAWKNLWRNRSRTLITASAVFFAVLLSTSAESLKQGIFDNLVKNVVSFYTGYIQIHKQGYQEEQILDNAFRQSPGLEKKIRTESNITAVTPRLESFSLAASGDLTRGCMVAGISPEGENRLTALKSKLTSGSYLEEEDSSVLLAEGLAEKLKLGIHDTIVLIGQGYHGATAAGKYRIKGLLKFGSPPLNDRMLYMSLPTAREFLAAEGMLTSYIISPGREEGLHETAGKIKQQLGTAYEVLTWEDILPDVKQHIATDSANMKVVQGVLYLLICFGIFSTLLMMLAERKYEMGMLVAIGMQKSKLALLLTGELVLTVLTGCIAGITVSIPVILWLKHYPIRIGGETAKAYERFGFEAVFPASADPSIFIYQGLIVLLIGLLLSLYPAWKVFKLNPVPAMRR
ncbi:MAG: ABC transporter permease [Chitinophagaceae bacterium]|nr:ABC transporter permease [Chitinophagaceae bacterium]